MSVRGREERRGKADRKGGKEGEEREKGRKAHPSRARCASGQPTTISNVPVYLVILGVPTNG